MADSWPAQPRAEAIALMQSGQALGYMLAAALLIFTLPETRNTELQ